MLPQAATLTWTSVRRTTWCAEIADSRFRKQSVGRSRSSFKCRKCNALNQRCTAMMKGTYAAKAWTLLTKEEKEFFRTQAQELKAAALQDALSCALVHKVRTRVNEFGGKLGEFLPLGVYKQRGYGAAAVKNIEATAENKWDPVLKEYTYALMVFSMGDKTEKLTETEVLWKPTTTNSASGSSSREEKSNVAETPSGSDDSSSAESVASMEADKDDNAESSKKAKKKKSIKSKKKRAKLEKKLAAKKLAEKKAMKQQQIDAKKISAAVAAPLKALRTGMGARLSKVGCDMVPAYVRQEAQRLLQHLEEIDTSWTAAASGNYDSSLNRDDALQKIKQATEVAKRLDCMLAMAEGLQEEDDQGPTSKKSKKKHT